jgi:hypothetical protein
MDISLYYYLLYTLHKKRGTPAYYITKFVSHG